MGALQLWAPVADAELSRQAADARLARQAVVAAVAWPGSCRIFTRMTESKETLRRRKRTDTIRTERIKIRVTAREKAELIELARAQGLSLAAYLVKCAGR